MKAYIFPGQGSQFVGMGKKLYEKSSIGEKLFNQANEILNFDITNIMFNGTTDELKQTEITQPAIFLHSVIIAKILGNKYQPDMTAGHSLGEFSALVAAKALSFKEGLILVSKRAEAMKKATKGVSSAMAAILGLEDKVVEEVCNLIEDIVVPANYNCPGQLVISGSEKGVELASNALLERGAKRAIRLNVSGAFHSPFMESARIALKKAIDKANFSTPICPIYQNVNAKATIDKNIIKQNLNAQLTAPVRWSDTIKNMVIDGATQFIELGPGKVLQGMLRKIDDSLNISGLEKL